MISSSTRRACLGGGPVAPTIALLLRAVRAASANLLLDPLYLCKLKSKYASLKSKRRQKKSTIIFNQGSTLPKTGKVRRVRTPRLAHLEITLLRQNDVPHALIMFTF